MGYQRVTAEDKVIRVQDAMGISRQFGGLSLCAVSLVLAPGPSDRLVDFTASKVSVGKLASNCAACIATPSLLLLFSASTAGVSHPMSPKGPEIC